MDSEDALAWVEYRASQVDAAERLLEQSIIQAREYGASWTQIGDAVGMSRQAAWNKYRFLDKEAGRV